MDLELGAEGWVYLAERDRIFRVKDTDGDGVGDREENLATLAIEGDYPHNGLSALAWHPDGDRCFGLGENLAMRWTLTGRDGAKFKGVGEGVFTDDALAHFEGEHERSFCAMISCTVGHKLVQHFVTGESQLFELEEDPIEMVNLAGSEEMREVESGLRTSLEKWSH